MVDSGYPVDGEQIDAADIGALYAGIISPAAIGASQNDYAPTGFSSAGMLRLTSSAAYDITGLAGGSAGRIVSVHNIGTFNITLKNASGSSVAANRFALTADLVLLPNMVVLLQYDGTTSRWRVIGGSAAMTTAEADLGADVTLTLANTYYDGPSVSLSIGTWFIVGTVTCGDSASAAQITAKLWNGTTVESSAQQLQDTAARAICLTVSGIVSPVAVTTYKISVASNAATNGKIYAECPINGVGNNASHIRAVKIG